MKAYVYILKFKNNDSYYVGSTDNLARRLRQHSHGNTPSTKSLGKFTLVFYQKVSDLRTARLAEKRIKSWKRRDFVEKIIQDGKIAFINNARRSSAG